MLDIPALEGFMGDKSRFFNLNYSVVGRSCYRFCQMS